MPDISDLNGITAIKLVQIPLVGADGAQTGVVPHYQLTRYNGDVAVTRLPDHAHCAYKDEIQAWLDAGGTVT